MMPPQWKPEHRAQRLKIASYTLGFVLALWFLLVVSWHRTHVHAAGPSTPIATTSGSSTTTGPTTEDDRISEISKSQDRFVETMLAITTLIGTGFFVLLGLNLLQNNRNAQRESDYAREYAEMQAMKAISSARAELQEFAVQVGVQMQGQIQRFETVAINRIGEAESKAKYSVESQAKEFERMYGETIVALNKSVLWHARETRSNMKHAEEKNETGVAQGLATSLFTLSHVLIEAMRPEQQTARNSDFLAAIALMSDAMSGMMLGQDVPEENELWYVNKGEVYSKTKAIIDHVKMIDRLKPTASSMERLLPGSPHQPDEKQLARLKLEVNRDIR